MAGKFTLDQVHDELSKILDGREVLTDKISIQEAYFIMQACQLTATHPKLGKPMVDRFVALGRRMQELLRPHVSAFFAEFLETGWHREFDE